MKTIITKIKKHLKSWFCHHRYRIITWCYINTTAIQVFYKCKKCGKTSSKILTNPMSIELYQNVYKDYKLC